MIWRVLAAWVVGALLLAGCDRNSVSTAPAPANAPAPAAAAAAAMPEEKVLNVYNWTDYIDPALIPAFEKETGIKVNYDVFDANVVLETKLLAGHSGYDLVVPTASFLQRQIPIGVYRPLDKALLPNLHNLDPDLTGRLALDDPGNQYAVIYFWGTSGLGYNAQKIAALPIGGRVKMDPWNDKLEMIKSKPIGTIAEREKMPFEVTPFMPYLTRFGSDAAKPVAASVTPPPDANKPGDVAPAKP